MRPILLGMLCLCASAQRPVFLEPTGKIDTNRAEVGDKIQTFRVVDGAKFQAWLAHPAAQRAMRLYGLALGILEEAGNPAKQPKEYYIALVPKGNHAAVGFRIEGDEVDHSKHAYILLDPSERSFSGTMLHETGHVAMSMLAGGRQLPRADVTSIPHTTAALTDRGTAFAEGYAIHLETLAGQLGESGRRQMDEYFRHSMDLMTYSQSMARITDVRDNNYAFESAVRDPDYLRVQLEKGRDFAEIRSANQLLQSEGFYGSLFFRWLMRGETGVDEAVIKTRQDRVLRAMRAMFESVKFEEDTPWLLRFVVQYAGLYPDERDALFDLVNAMSHGAFVDRDAARLWREHYLAALRLDLKGINQGGLVEARKKWRAAVVSDPQVLFGFVRPQLRCEIGAVQISIEIFGEASPLIFDINTVQRPLLRLVPGLTEAQAETWMKVRPFGSAAEFREKVGKNACTP